jgi:electron transport complex protein RnfG
MDKNAKFIIKLALILFTISAVCVFALALCNNLTKDTIYKINLENEENARKEVLQAEIFEKVQFDSEEVYVGKCGDEKVGYAIKVSPKGFGANIDMMVGIDKDGVISGISIINISETPGLGSKANDDKFLSQYISLSDNIKVIKSGTPSGNEINAISGATVTSNAVTKGVNDALYIYKQLAEVEK